MTVSPSTLALAAPAARRPAVAPAIARPERVRARIALRAPAGSRTWVIWYLPHDPADVPPSSFLRLSLQIGRALCRERVCQYVWFSVVAVTLKKKIKT